MKDIPLCWKLLALHYAPDAAPIYRGLTIGFSSLLGHTLYLLNSDNGVDWSAEEMIEYQSNVTMLKALEFMAEATARMDHDSRNEGYNAMYWTADYNTRQADEMEGTFTQEQQEIEKSGMSTEQYITLYMLITGEIVNHGNTDDTDLTFDWAHALLS